MRARKESRDEGFTLIELIVVVGLVGLVAIAVVSVLIGLTTAERSVRTVNTATNAGQLVTRTMTDRLTNAATPIELTAVGTDQLIKAEIAGQGASVTWTCYAWYYNAASRTIRYTTYTPPLATVTASSTATWILLADGVRPVSPATTIFTAVGTVGINAVFTVDAGSSLPVKFDTAMTSQTRVTTTAAQAAGGPTCF